MGVYINMEMPKSCGKCKLFDTSHAIGLFSPLGWCRVNGKEIFRLSEKADFCPLTEVPEPHGRLGDLDAVAKQVDYIANLDWNKQVGVSGGMLAALEVVEDAPTIIPAEEGE